MDKVWLGRMGRLMIGILFSILALAANADVVIGQVAPLSGVLASTGQQMVLGGKVCFDAVNAQGGVHGQKIRTVVLDDGYKVDETLRLTKDLVSDPQVVALFGFAGTANVSKLLQDKVLEQGGIALVAPYTGGEPLRKPFNPWIFHVRAGYADEAEHMGSIITGLALGVIEGLTKVFYPEASTTAVFLIMVIVLLIRPAGLFGKTR